MDSDRPMASLPIVVSAMATSLLVACGSTSPCTGTADACYASAHARIETSGGSTASEPVADAFDVADAIQADLDVACRRGHVQACGELLAYWTARRNQLGGAHDTLPVVLDEGDRPEGRIHRGGLTAEFAQMAMVESWALLTHAWFLRAKSSDTIGDYDHFLLEFRTAAEAPQATRRRLELSLQELVERSVVGPVFVFQAEHGHIVSAEGDLFILVKESDNVDELDRYLSAFSGTSDPVVEQHMAEIGRHWEELVLAQALLAAGMERLALLIRLYEFNPESAEIPEIYSAAFAEVRESTGPETSVGRASFYRAFPEAPQRGEVAEMAYRDVRALRIQDRVEALKAFQRIYADHPLAETARAAEIDLARQLAVDGNSVGPLYAFARNYPNADHREVTEALARILIHDWRNQRLSRYEVFARDFDDSPEAARVARAGQRLKEHVARQERRERAAAEREERRERAAVERQRRRELASAQRQRRQAGSSRRSSRRCQIHVCPRGLVAGRQCIDYNFGCIGEYTAGPCTCPN